MASQREIIKLRLKLSRMDQTIGWLLEIIAVQQQEINNLRLVIPGLGR